MSNPSFQSSKAEIFRGMMRRPETAKLIKEAMASPLGSTSRQKAQKIFSIMGKLHSSHDGMGGPGMIFNPMDTGQTMAPDTGPVTISNEDSKGMVIFHKIPKPRIIYGKKVPTKKQILDGRGGPGDFSTLTAVSSPLSSLAGVQPQTGIPGFSSIPTFVSGAAKNTGSGYAQGSTPLLTGYPSSMTNAEASALRSPAIRPSTLPNLYSLFETPFTDTSRFTQPKNITEAGTGDLGKTFPTLDNKSFSIDREGKLVSSAPPYVGLKIPPPPPAPVYSAVFPPPPVGTKTTAVTTPGVATPSFYSTLGGSTTSSTETSGGGITEGLSNLGSTGSTAVKSAKSFTERLVGVESGGDYSAVGPTITSGENAGYRALGKYQIMPNLHFSTIGLDANKEADVQKFLTTPALQDELYSKIITALAAKYNNDEAKVAAAYFGGDRAAQVVGTPEGDKITDGRLSVNQYVSRVLGGSPPGSIGGGDSTKKTGEEPAPTGIVATALDYIKKNLGAGAFIQDTMKKEGGLLNEQAAKNYDEVMKKYDIEKLKIEETTLKKEVATLPEDYASYIRARDTYIKETDKAIEDYKAEMQKNNDISDPAVKQQMSLHLNYLYTLRGRQNATYAGYLKDAVDGHDRKLKDLQDTLTSRIDEANVELTSKNAITTEAYNNRMASLNDLYTSLKNAPAEALQMTILEAQAHEAQYGSATDSIKMMKDNSFIQQGGDLKGIVWNKDGYILPGAGNGTPSVRLLDKINQLGATDPLILPSNIVLSYLTGVENYLSAPLSKDEFDGYGITEEKKRQLAAEAIVEVGLLTLSDDPQIAAAGRDYEDKIKQQFINIFAPYISSSGKAPTIMEAIKNLDRGKKAPPTLDEFIKIVTGKTQDEKDSSTAESIYNTYMEFIQGGETPSTAVRAFLYPGNTTEERSKATTPFSPLEFSYLLSRLVADDIYSRSLLS